MEPPSFRNGRKNKLMNQWIEFLGFYYPFKSSNVCGRSEIYVILIFFCKSLYFQFPFMYYTYSVVFFVFTNSSYLFILESYLK